MSPQLRAIKISQLYPNSKKLNLRYSSFRIMIAQNKSFKKSSEGPRKLGEVFKDKL
jgi:hypothetical protein